MRKKIKVLILTHTFPTKYNPIAAVFLLNQLRELKKYYNIKIIFPYAYIPKIKILNPYYKYSKIPKSEKINELQVYHPKYLMFPRILFIPKFLNFFLVIESFFSYMTSRKTADSIIEEWGPDIIHMHGSLSEGLLGVRLKRKYNKPLLVTTYGEDITLYSKKMFSKSLSKLALKNSDAVICQSKFLENEIKGIGLHNKKFFVIPMGADTKQFKPKNKEKARKILNLPLNKKIILFVGHLVPRKGVRYLIKSLQTVLKKEKNILCLVIGKGEEQKKLKKLASELNLDRYVKFLGQKTHEEVVPYMNACDIFVLPSLNEGLPVVLCEALACGRPVVATAVAGTPELITKDVGYLVKPKNANDLAQKIVLALNKKWDIKKLTKKGNEFSVPESAKKIVNLYRELLRLH